MRTEERVRAEGLPEDAERPDARSRPTASRTRASPSSRASPRTRCGARRARLGVRPVYKRIDTCAAEFEAQTPYMYSCYETAPWARSPRTRRGRRTGARSSSWAAGRTGSGRGSSSTTAACHAAFAPQGGRHRDDDGQLQPRDRLDRLRHLGPALLRAADRSRTCSRSAASRPPAASSWASSSSSAGRRRSSSRTAWSAPACRSSAPRPTRSTSPRTASASSGLLHRLGLRQPANATAKDARRGVGEGEGARLPARHPPVLRAGRPGDADRARARRGRGLRRRRRARVGDGARAARPLPLGRDRDRRRRAGRRRDGPGRGRDGARRGGGRPLGRQRLLAAPLHAAPGHRARGRAPGGGPRRGAERPRPDERADGGQGRRGLHPRGQPARQPHRPVRRQGRRAPRSPGSRPA